MAIDVLRKIMLGTQQTGIATMTVTVADTVAAYLNNKKRRELSSLEDDAKLKVEIIGREGVNPEFLEITATDASGRTVSFPTG